MPRRASGGGGRARAAAYRVLHRFGYLQLDSVAVAGARSHAIVLLSRIEGMDPILAEELLQPGQPLFEYWGHEASWIPLDLYPCFGWRRRQYRRHPWWGDVLGDHGSLAAAVMDRITEAGPLRSSDLSTDGDRLGRWEWAGPTRKVLSALWSAGELAIAERRGFQRHYDLTERVIPAAVRRRRVDRSEALRRLLWRSLCGHGWASRGTLAATFRLRNMSAEIDRALHQLAETGDIVRCTLRHGCRSTRGWIRVADLELIPRLQRIRPRADVGVLLSPFDPILWDRRRAALLFDFEAVLEVFKPRDARRYGYYCLSVLAGDRLVARYDLKADRSAGRLRVISCHLESDVSSAAARRAGETALRRYGDVLGLRPVPLAAGR